MNDQLKQMQEISEDYRAIEKKILEKYTSVLVNTISGPVIAVLYYKVFGSCLEVAWKTGHYGELFHELLRIFILSALTYSSIFVVEPKYKIRKRRMEILKNHQANGP